jgi:hypothetical protein
MAVAPLGIIAWQLPGKALFAILAEHTPGNKLHCN